MTKLCSTVVFTAAVLLVWFPAAAQTSRVHSTQGIASANPQFAQLDQMLSRTADDVLASAAQPLPEPQAKAEPEANQPKSQITNLRSGLERVRQLRPVIEPILRQEGVPLELSAVVLVESGGQPTALSPKGARGLWQLMPDTARRYGLVVTPERDDRLDVLKSTHAAARYLRDLYAQFGNWSEALAAYNAGEQAVASLLKRTGATDFRAISYRLPNETRNYVPAVLTAMRWFGDPLNESGHSGNAGRILFASFVSGE